MSQQQRAMLEKMLRKVGVINFIYLIIFVMCFSSCNENQSTKSKVIEKYEVYKFHKILRLPNSLEINHDPLTNMEERKLDSLLRKAGQKFFRDNKGDFYLLFDKDQNDLILQFFSITGEITE